MTLRAVILLLASAVFVLAVACGPKTACGMLESELRKAGARELDIYMILGQTGTREGICQTALDTLRRQLGTPTPTARVQDDGRTPSPFWINAQQ